MKVILSTIGSLGDVLPFIGLGAALQARGHRVVLMTNPFFEAAAKRADLELVPLGSSEDYERVIRQSRIWHHRMGFRFVVRDAVTPLIRPMYEAIAERSDEETVVAGNILSFGARLAQEKLGCRLATLDVFPGILRSCHQSSVTPGLFTPDWLPPFLKHWQFQLIDVLFLDRFLGAAINGFRQELGLRPVYQKLFAGWLHSPERVIGLFPEWFAPPQPDWPPQTTLTNFPLYDDSIGTEIPAAAADFLAAGEPPILFTRGSGVVNARAFFTAAAEACRQLGRRGVFVTRDPSSVPTPLPPGVRRFDFIPFSWLMPRCAAVVHHSGIGTVAQALAAGVPQLLLPACHDQPDNAVRLERIRAGINLRSPHCSAAKMTSSLRELLASESIKTTCRRLAAATVIGDPFAAAIDLLEQMAERDSRPRQPTYSAKATRPVDDVLTTNKTDGFFTP